MDYSIPKIIFNSNFRWKSLLRWVQPRANLKLHFFLSPLNLISAVDLTLSKISLFRKQPLIFSLFVNYRYALKGILWRNKTGKFQLMMCLYVRLCVCVREGTDGNFWSTYLCGSINDMTPGCGVSEGKVLEKYLFKICWSCYNVSFNR